MNIQSVLSKVYNTVKFSQIPEDEVTAENFGRASYMAGMLDSAKIFMKIYNGEVDEREVEYEMAKLKKEINA